MSLHMFRHCTVVLIPHLGYRWSKIVQVELVIHSQLFQFIKMLGEYPTNIRIVYLASCFKLSIYSLVELNRQMFIKGWVTRTTVSPYVIFLLRHILFLDKLKPSWIDMKRKLNAIIIITYLYSVKIALKMKVLKEAVLWPTFVCLIGLSIKDNVLLVYVRKWMHAH